MAGSKGGPSNSSIESCITLNMSKRHCYNWSLINKQILQFTCMKLKVPCIWAMRSCTACFRTTGSVAGGGGRTEFSVCASELTRAGLTAAGGCCGCWRTLTTWKSTITCWIQNTTGPKVAYNSTKRFNEWGASYLRTCVPLCSLLFFTAAVSGLWNELSVYKLAGKRSVGR